MVNSSRSARYNDGIFETHLAAVVPITFPKFNFFGHETNSVSRSLTRHPPTSRSTDLGVTFFYEIPPSEHERSVVLVYWAAETTSSLLFDAITPKISRPPRLAIVIMVILADLQQEAFFFLVQPQFP